MAMTFLPLVLKSTIASRTSWSLVIRPPPKADRSRTRAWTRSSSLPASIASTTSLSRVSGGTAPRASSTTAFDRLAGELLDKPPLRRDDEGGGVGDIGIVVAEQDDQQDDHQRHEEQIHEHPPRGVDAAPTPGRQIPFSVFILSDILLSSSVVPTPRRVRSSIRLDAGHQGSTCRARRHSRLPPAGFTSVTFTTKRLAVKLAAVAGKTTRGTVMKRFAMVAIPALLLITACNGGGRRIGSGRVAR